MCCVEAFTVPAIPVGALLPLSADHRPSSGTLTKFYNQMSCNRKAPLYGCDVDWHSTRMTSRDLSTTQSPLRLCVSSKSESSFNKCNSRNITAVIYMYTQL